MINTTRLLSTLALLSAAPAASAASFDPPAEAPDPSTIEAPTEPAPSGPLEPMPLPNGSFTAPEAESSGFSIAPDIEWSPLNLAIAGFFLLLIAAAIAYEVARRISGKR